MMRLTSLLCAWVCLLSLANPVWAEDKVFTPRPKFVAAPVPSFTFDWNMVKEVPQAYLSDYPACMLRYESTSSIDKANREVISVHALILLNERSALASYGSYPITEGWIAENTEFQIHQLRIHRPGKKAFDVPAEQVLVRQASTEGIFEEHEALAMLEDLQVGDVIEYHTSNLYDHNLKPGQVWDRYAWATAELPIVKETLHVRLPKDKSFSYRTFGNQNSTFKKTETGNLADYSWEANLVETLDVPDAGPSTEVLDSGVAFTSFRDWAEVAAWEVAIWNNKLEPTKAITEQAKKLTAHLKNDKDKIAAICQYCRDAIRYRSAKHISGVIPHDPHHVMATGCGDCKDTTALACSLFKAIKINAYPISLLTEDSGQMPHEIPCPYSDHAIVLIEHQGRQYWFESAYDTCQWDQLPWYSSGRNAYALVGKEIRLVKTPPLTAKSGGIEDQVKITLAKTGNSTLHVKRTYSGRAASDIRDILWNLSAKKRHEEVASSILDYYEDFQLKSVKLDRKNFYNLEEPLVVEMTFETSKTLGSFQVWSVHTWENLTWLDMSESRPAGWALETPITIKETIEVTTEPGSSLHTYDFTKNLTSPFAEFRRSIAKTAKNPETLIMTFELKVKKTRILPEEWKTFKTFRDSADEINYASVRKLTSKPKAVTKPAKEPVSK